MAKHVKLDCYRIIKKISKASKFFGRLSKEAFLMKNLNHSSIPQIFDIEEDSNYLYVIEQFIEGEPLRALCSKNRLSEQEIISIAKQVCEILKYLHSLPIPVYHLDIKPDNIIISGTYAYLVDFGSALRAGEDENCFFGTPGYAPPEQFGKGIPDERSDIFGIGTLIYYMLVGTSYTKNDMKNIDLDVICSKRLKRIVNRCLKEQVFFRFLDADSLCEQLKCCFNSSTKQDEKEVMRIAVAGAANRIGTTHIALMLCFFLDKLHKNSIYLERNQSGMLIEFAVQNGLRMQSDNVFPFVYKYNKVILAKDSIELTFISDDRKDKLRYSCFVEDYGKLSRENLCDFTTADYCFVVLGCREWETNFNMAAIKMAEERRDVKRINYIFNLTSQLSFASQLKKMGKRRCFRISFEPEFITGSELAEQMFSEILFNIKKLNK